MTIEDNPALPAIAVVGGLLLLVGIGFGLRGLGIFETKTFGVAEQNADTEVYRHSEAYREGLQRDCADLKLAYVQAKTPDEKAAILSALRHRVDGAPPELVPADVKALLEGGGR